MRLAILLGLAGFFLSSLVWLMRNWNAAGPTELGRDVEERHPSQPYLPLDSTRPDRPVHNQLTAIGYWSTSIEPAWPDQRAFTDASWDASERGMVVSHLRRGMLLVPPSGSGSVCPTCQERSDRAELTDGTYVWPGFLAHQVETHDVRMPGLFVLHVSRYSEPSLASERYAADLDVVDTEWWRSLEGP